MEPWQQWLSNSNSGMDFSTFGLPQSMTNRNWVDPMTAKDNKYNNTQFDIFGKPKPTVGQFQKSTLVQPPITPRPSIGSALPKPNTPFTPQDSFAQDTFKGVGADGSLTFSDRGY